MFTEEGGKISNFILLSFSFFFFLSSHVKLHLFVHPLRGQSWSRCPLGAPQPVRDAFCRNGHRRVLDHEGRGVGMA